MRKTFGQLNELLNNPEWSHVKSMPRNTNPLDHVVWPDCPIYDKDRIVSIDNLRTANARLKSELVKFSEREANTIYYMCKDAIEDTQIQYVQNKTTENFVEHCKSIQNKINKFREVQNGK
jgi:hypothetical protein